MRSLRWWWCTWMLVACGPAWGKDPIHVHSPDRRLQVQLHSDHDGVAHYRVLRDGTTLVDDSRLGFLFGNAQQFLRNVAIDEIARNSVDTTWEQPWGETRLVRDHHNALRVRLRETGRLQRALELELRVFDDGIGLRYAFPADGGWDAVVIDEELTEFAIAPPSTAWWIPGGEWNRYEYLYQRTPLREVGVAHTPLTLRTDQGVHIALHEAALVDYAGMWLQRVDGQRFKARLAPSAAQAGKVRRTAPFATPWRTLHISDDASGLAQSNLILNLNAPNALGDVSWFRPHKYVGIWWSLHLENESWASGASHGATTANTRRYIDFAADNGFAGVLVEGWNRGWDGDWFANGWGFDFTTPTDDYDLQGLAAYAGSRGVQLIAHNETACAVSHYERQMPQAFALYRRLGIGSIKSGYVCDAGQIERQDAPDGPVLREWHDGQWMSNHHLRVLREAARQRLALNVHEPVKDTGLRRTWPNAVSREGARGMEYNAWAQPPNPPEHEANLVFTRMLAGPMDFTPGIVSLTGRGGQPIQSTLAKQLALYVVLYSPVQMVADLPEHYARHPQAFEFIKQVPTDWDQTRVLAGEVGDLAVIARKDRHSADWYVGAVGDEQPRSMTVPLDFLDSGRSYRAHIHADGTNAHWLGQARFSIAHSTREVNRTDSLTITLAPGGGQAIRLQALPHDSAAVQ